MLCTWFGVPEILQVTEVAMSESGPRQARNAVPVVGVNTLILRVRRGGLAKVFPTSVPATTSLDLAAATLRERGDKGGVEGAQPLRLGLWWSARQPLLGALGVDRHGLVTARRDGLFKG